MVGLSLQGWDVSLAVARLRAFMSELGFSVVRPFVCRVRCLCRLPAAKRTVGEAWRRKMLEEHVASFGHDVERIQCDDWRSLPTTDIAEAPATPWLYSLKFDETHKS